MKLMSPTQLKDTKAVELQRDLLRTQELNELADKARKNLANAQADFTKTLSDNRQQWAKDENEHAKRVTEMGKEIETLEARQAKALEPVHLREKEADELLAKAQSLLTEVKQREENAQGLISIFQDKLDNLGAREQDVITSENRARLMLTGAEQQQEHVKTQVASLTKAIADFATEKLAWNDKMGDRSEDLEMQELSLKAKAENLKRTEEALVNWELQLKDREGTLKRNLERLSPYKSNV